MSSKVYRWSTRAVSLHDRMLSYQRSIDVLKATWTFDRDNYSKGTIMTCKVWSAPTGVQTHAKITYRTSNVQDVMAGVPLTPRINTRKT